MTDDSTVGKLGPISATYNARIACTHVQSAVRIAAERELFFEPIHRVKSVSMSRCGG
jgi:hypothetical protein